MEMRTATGKILLALAGTLGVALAVFVVAPWLQSPPPPVSPVSPDEIIQEVMGPAAENDGELMDEAEAVAGALDEVDETILPAPGPDAEPVAEDGEDQEIVGVLPAPLTPDEVASAMVAPSATSAPEEEGRDEVAVGEPVEAEERGDEAAGGEAVESAVSQFAEAVLERLEEIVQASAGSPDAVVMASAPSVEEGEGETAGPAPKQVTEPVPAEAATAVETLGGQAEPPPEVIEEAAAGQPVVIERDMRIEFSTPVVEVAAASTGSLTGAPVALEGPAPPLGPLEPPAQPPSVLPAAGLAELRPAEAVTAPYVPRGGMGYRMPLVSRQELPIQIVSGVVMPAHHAYVILRPGYWELLMESGETVVPVEPVEAVVEEPLPAPRRRWSLLDLFRKRTPARVE